MPNISKLSATVNGEICDIKDAYARSELLKLEAEIAAMSGNIEGSGLPETPSEDGTYLLQVVVSNGVPTYSWVAAAPENTSTS